MNVIGIIPARYDSTRLKGKPLLDISGKSMVRRVYEQALKAKRLNKVVVATDSEVIENECKLHHIEVVMTSPLHNNGTERCGEVIAHFPNQYDIAVNIQGDEPFIHPQSIDQLIEVFIDNKSADIASLKKKITDAETLNNPSIIKLVTDRLGKALYFSRSSIPFLRDDSIGNWCTKADYYKHIGLYAYKTDILKEIVKLPETVLEKTEKLEQLRWLENGFQIYIAETEFESKSIDTKEDYEYIIHNIHKFIA